MAEKTTAVIYTRVSTAVQVDGYSLEAQKNELEDEAKHKHWKIIGRYSDEGKSGKNISGRPAFRQMMDDLKDDKKRPDYIMVFKLSRFGRNVTDILNSVKYMESWGVNLFVLKDGIDSAQITGKILITILGSVAELERDNIATQSMAGRIQKAKDGKWNGGPAPYGYEIDKSGGKGNSKLVVNPEEAEIVKKIYKMYLDGMGVNAIARKLNDEGYSKGAKGKKSAFQPQYIQRMLDNETYMGCIRYGKIRAESVKGSDEVKRVRKKEGYEVIPGAHEAIIQPEDWYKVHTLRELRTKSGIHEMKHDKNRVHLLSGILRCPVCGGPMAGNVYRAKKPGGGYYKEKWYYVCKHRKMVEGNTACTFNKYVPQEALNKEVEAAVKKAPKDIRFIEALGKKFGFKNDTKGPEESVERLKKEVKKAEASLDRLKSWIRNLSPDDDQYDAKMEEYNEIMSEDLAAVNDAKLRLAQAQERLDNAKSRHFTAEQMIMASLALAQNLDELSDVDEREAFRTLIDKIEINEKPDKNGVWLKKITFHVEPGLYFHPEGMKDLQPDESRVVTRDVKDWEIYKGFGKGEPQFIEYWPELDKPEHDRPEITNQMIKDRCYQKYGVEVTDTNIRWMKMENGLDYRYQGGDEKNIYCPVEKRKALEKTFDYFGLY